MHMKGVSRFVVSKTSRVDNVFCTLDTKGAYIVIESEVGERLKRPSQLWLDYQEGRTIIIIRRDEVYNSGRMGMSGPSQNLDAISMWIYS